MVTLRAVLPLIPVKSYLQKFSYPESPEILTLINKLLKMRNEPSLPSKHALESKQPGTSSKTTQTKGRRAQKT